MDAHELRRLLAELDGLATEVHSALFLVGPGRRLAEIHNATDHARRRLSDLRGILAERREEAEAQRHHDDVNRRDLLKLVPAFSVSAGALERLASAHHTDDALLDAYREVVTEASRAYHSAHMPDLYATVGPHVLRLAERLRGEMSEDHRRRLGRIVAETAILAGWNALIVGRESYARSHYSLARSAAHLAGSGDLEALAVEAQANLSSRVFYGGWTPSPQALQGLQRAESLLDGSGPPIVRQWVLSRLAHEMAVAGDPRFMDVVDRAREMDGPPDEEPTGLHVPGGYWASGNRLADIEAVGLTMTGRADQAEAIMRAEVESTPESLPRRHVGIGMILGHVHAGQGEPEEAARVAMEALELATDRASALDVQRLAGVHGRLARWDVPVVRELGQRIASVS